MKYWWVYVGLGLYFVLVSQILVNRFKQYEVFYFDHGIYDGSLWSVAQGKWPLIDHLEDRLINQLGDHFNPWFYGLAIIYRVTNSYTFVLYLQAALITLSGYIIWLIGRHFKIPVILITAIVLAYLFFIGTQNVMIAQLHPELLAMVSLAAGLYFNEKKQRLGFWLAVLLTLGLKEVFAAPLIVLGGIKLLKKEYKSGLSLILICGLWFFGVTQWMMPQLAGRAYQYQTNYHNLLKPWLIFSQPSNRETIGVALTTFGLLPLLSGVNSWLLVQDFVTRMLISTVPAHASLGLHHNALTAVILAYLTLIALVKNKWLRVGKVKYGVALLILMMAGYYHRVIYHGPLGLGVNAAFYQNTQNFAFLDKLVAQVPKNTTLMTFNNLAPHLTHGNEVWLLRDKYWLIRPNYLVLDFRPGQNPNNYWPLQEKALLEMKQKLVYDKSYRVYYQNGEQIIYERVE